MAPSTAHPQRGTHLKRLLSGPLLFPAAVLFIWWSPGGVFAGGVCLLALGAAGEVFALAAARGLRPVRAAAPRGAGAAPARAAVAPAAGGRAAALGALALAGAIALAPLALAGGDPGAALA